VECVASGEEVGISVPLYSFVHIRVERWEETKLWYRLTTGKGKNIMEPTDIVKRNSKPPERTFPKHQ
jgi:hypothetical protein